MREVYQGVEYVEGQHTKPVACGGTLVRYEHNGRWTLTANGLLIARDDGHGHGGNGAEPPTKERKYWWALPKAF
jgi:hypothetical protein